MDAEQRIQNAYKNKYDISITRDLLREYEKYLFLKKGVTKSVPIEEWTNFKKTLPPQKVQIPGRKYVEPTGCLIYEDNRTNPDLVYYRLEPTNAVEYKLHKEIENKILLLAQIQRLQHQLGGYDKTVNYDDIKSIEVKIEKLFKEVLDIKEGSVPEEENKSTNEKDLIDLSDNRDIDKVRTLIVLGVIDDLSKNKYKHSTGALATALSGALGIKSDTLRGYLNAYLTQPDSKNNPMNNKSAVQKIKNKLNIE